MAWIFITITTVESTLGIGKVNPGKEEIEMNVDWMLGLNQKTKISNGGVAHGSSILHRDCFDE